MPSTATNQSAQEELAHRAADLLPGLEAAKLAVGLEDHRAMLAGYRARVSDGHKAGMKALGMEDTQQPGADEMGITIARDINNYAAPLAAVATTPAAESASATPSAPMSFAKKAAMTAALIAGGAGLPVAGIAANSFFNKPAAPAVVAPATDNDTQFELRLLPNEPVLGVP